MATDMSGVGEGGGGGKEEEEFKVKFRNKYFASKGLFDFILSTLHIFLH